MKKLILVLAGAFLLATPVGAVPNSFFGNGNAIPIIPAFPRFNADLTREFLDVTKWREGDFSGPWREEPSLPDLAIRRMRANPVVLGEVPMSVIAYEDESGVKEVAVHFLDAGLFFGYRSGGEQSREEREAGRDRRREFDDHYEELADSIRERLEEGCGDGRRGNIGRTRELRTDYIDYRWEGFVLRFVAREEHSVSVHILRAGDAPRHFVDPDWIALDHRDREDRLERRVTEARPAGRRIEGLPVFTQGNTPFCGIHSLTMVGRYFGLRAGPETLAAAAEFENTGSAGGSDMVDLYRAVGRELDMRVSVAPRFDADRVERSIEDGLPVIVWRRVSREREAAHRELAERRRSDRELRAPKLTDEELDRLPARDEKGTPSHASVITGIDREGGEVIYVEPWGREGRGRRMTFEEMEATAYAVFRFRL